jgi:hypothetical protein
MTSLYVYVRPGARPKLQQCERRATATHGYLRFPGGVPPKHLPSQIARNRADSSISGTAAMEASWKPQPPGSNLQAPQELRPSTRPPSEIRKRPAAARSRSLMVSKGSSVRVRCWAWLYKATSMPKAQETEIVYRERTGTRRDGTSRQLPSRRLNRMPCRWHSRQSAYPSSSPSVPAAAQVRTAFFADGPGRSQGLGPCELLLRQQEVTQPSSPMPAYGQQL